MTDQSPPIPSTSSSTSAPTFKKKKRPTANQRVNRVESPAEPTGEEGGEDEEVADQTSETLEQLLAIRKLKRTTAGLDIERLNAGEQLSRKKRLKVTNEGLEDKEVVGENGMIEGQHGGLKNGAGGGGGRDRVRDEGEAAEAKRKIVKSDNFTGQTNTVDVDKHMMAYIEAELAKKRGVDPAVAEAAAKSLDPRDELYRVAEKYKFADVEEKVKTKQDKEEEEGNVTLSTGMLMGIPEVDLGIDIKLKNIEDTEKAKRNLYDSQVAAAKKAEQDREEFAVERFYRHNRPTESDNDALSKARQNLAMSEEEAQAAIERASGGGGMGGGRRQHATDDMAMERFKKRQRQQWGK